MHEISCFKSLNLSHQSWSGLDCKRSEVSGFRFWNFVKTLCSTPDQFTSRCLVYNLCPLYFVAESGRNIPLNELELEVRKQLISKCGESLVEVLELFNVQDIVCLGRFVESQVKAIVRRRNLSVRVHFLVHPSPASPMANSGWDKIAIKTFQDIGLLQLISPECQQSQEMPDQPSNFEDKNIDNGLSSDATS